MIIYLIVGLLIIAGIYLISTYNFFVSSKTRVGAAIQEIGNQLKRQAELIPNLEASVKGYLKHEKGIFDELTEARKSVVAAAKSGNLKKMADAGKALADVLPKIQVVVESNPQLRGAEVVTDLMNELRDTSDKVMYARRLLIDLTADYNVKLVSFPSNLVAGVFHFERLPGLSTPEETGVTEVGKEETKTPKINL
jgi:LemA protein